MKIIEEEDTEKVLDTIKMKVKGWSVTAQEPPAVGIVGMT